VPSTLLDSWDLWIGWWIGQTEKKPACMEFIWSFMAQQTENKIDTQIKWFPWSVLSRELSQIMDLQSGGR
jgi:hypothetical protein